MAKPTSDPLSILPIERIAARRLVIVTGKGGVGKSTVAAALAWGLAARGARTLALEVDPRENLHQLFEVPPSGGEVVEVGGSLALQNLQPTSALEDILRRQVRLQWVAERILASPLYEQFARGMPGLKELAILDHALGVTGPSRQSGGRFDTVVLDAPATGHGLSLLAAPRLVASTVARGPVHDRAQKLADLLADPAAVEVVAVTLAEEMPVDETLELQAALAVELGRRAGLLIVNSLYPPLPATLSGKMDAAAVDLWRRRRAINERELARLAAAGEAWAELPLLPLPPGRELVRGLGRLLLEAAEP